MQIKNLFKSDINRSINGVIKVAQDDETSIKQELEEYVVTRELNKHFVTFLNNYENSITFPTDKVGVWISGFFGSGKSHFLKILSYILSNREVGGKKAVEYFEDKFDDPMLFAQLEQCTKPTTDTILFNIDSKSPLTKDSTAILRVFAKVFYEHLGFYGNDLKVAKFEQHFTKEGVMDAFKSKFEEINGDKWENSRDSYTFFEDDIVEALVSLGKSEVSARNWFNGEEEVDLDIETLVKEIKDYVDSRGKDYRLLFMIDEVGQYIGSDSSLMLNLQTIVEEIGTKCGGQVWVMVTSQEAIDSITKISGDDFSKIQGRFNTRLSLSSSSVDEVIKRRILAKTSDAENLLRMRYTQDSAVLKNLFTFNGAVLDLKGYGDATDYVETYPFVPYQFKLMQNVLAQIRKHGNSGKHLSGGERSMLSGFQEAAQVIENKDETALIPFSLFYNTVHTFLESAIRRVIDRCQRAADNHDGIEAYDVEILKLLYLIRYVDDIKSNVDNITTLMVNDISADKINMRKEIQESLDRLYSQNYISRNGDTYQFLTDDEQDIEREIRQIVVDNSAIVNNIASTVFNDIYANKKFKYGKYDFSFDQYVDDVSVGSTTGGIKLRVLTSISDLFNSGEATILLKSKADNEAIVVMSEDFPYYNELHRAMQIRKYMKGINVSEKPEAIQAIIRGKQQEATAHESRASVLIGKSIAAGKFYVTGEKVDIKAGGVKEKLDALLTELIENVYSRLTYIRKNYDSDADILTILSGNNGQISMDSVKNPNYDAQKEINEYLEMQSNKMMTTSMGDLQRRYSGIPYGWREVDIAACVAALIADQKISIQYGGSTIQPNDRRMPDYLRKRSEIDKANVIRRVKLSDKLIKDTRGILKDYLNTMDVPNDEDGLITYVISKFEVERNELQNMLDKYYATDLYPGKGIVENGINICNAILSQKKDNTALLTRITDKEDDLFEHSDDMVKVRSFFSSQKPVFDAALSLADKMKGESSYLQAEDDLKNKVKRVYEIIKMQNPYKSIPELPGLSQEIKDKYDAILTVKRTEVLSDIQSAMAAIHQEADSSQMGIVKNADSALTDKRDEAGKSSSMTSLDAMKIQIENIKNQYLSRLMKTPDPEIKTATMVRSSLGYTTKLKNEDDINEFVEYIREKLKENLEGNDELHII